MKKFFYILTLILLCANLNAQELELKELTVPSSPAFTLLGLNPTEISRPTLAKPFVMSLANGLNGKNIVSDVSIESTPYWWKSRRGLTYKQYFGIEDDNKSKNLFNQIIQTVSVSFATSDASPDIDSINSRYISSGLRFYVLRGKPSNKFIKSYYSTLQHDILLKRESIAHIKFKVKREVITTQKQLNEDIPISVEEILSTNDVLKNVDGPDNEVLKKMVVAYISELVKNLGKHDFDKTEIVNFLENERGKLSDKVNETLVDMNGMSRVGWLLEFAGASSLLAPNNQIDYTIGHEWASWGTLTYRLDSKEGSKHVNDFNLMIRLGGNFQNTSSYNRDLGLSWVTIGDNHSLTLEGIFRSYRTYKDITATDGNIYKVTETDNTWRLALSYQYKISEAINLSVSAGKDFANSNISSGGVFSLLNFNLILPSQQVISINE